MKDMMRWIRLAWNERDTDFTSHEAWGVPAYEHTRRLLLMWRDWQW